MLLAEVLRQCSTLVRQPPKDTGDTNVTYMACLHTSEVYTIQNLIALRRLSSF